jgi:lysozyme family protein
MAMTIDQIWGVGIEFVIRHEGGYVSDPDDPGGETKYGISKRAHPELDIKNLSPRQAANIYRTEYWDRLGLALLHAPLAWALMDSAVNCGKKRAVKWAQNAHNGLDIAPKLQVNGVMGPETIAGIMVHTLAPELLAMALLNYRVGHYHTIIQKNTKLKKYLRGWLRRVTALQSLIINNRNR